MFVICNQILPQAELHESHSSSASTYFVQKVKTFLKLFFSPKKSTVAHQLCISSTDTVNTLRVCRDTDEGCGENSHDGSYWDGSLGVSEIT